MNKLNKKIISFVFLFSICLLVNVSYAEFSTTDYLSSSANFIQSSASGNEYAGYTIQEIQTICSTYAKNGYELSSNASEYNTMLQAITDNGYNFVLDANVNTGNFWIGQWSDTGLIDLGPNSNFIVYWSNGDWFDYYTGSLYLRRKCNVSGISVNNFLFYDDDEHNQINVPCKQLIKDSSGYLWTGQYLISFQPPTDEPTMPTNSEIAQAVQAFYNSDYYKNNKDFKDFIVLLNTKTNTIDFIGHNFSEYLSQQIIPANYEYDGEKYSQDWWRFYLRAITDQIKATLFEKYYWLYSTTDLGATIEYNGKGYMNDLLDLRFTTATVIIYSTADYYVQTFEKDDEDIYQPVTGTIPGNQYTYDENLDITENQYNPLDTFVPTNPSQSILGDVDFSEINKTFEENKDILNIENASWLFTANNKLVGYFIGFLSLLIVFLIISRILGG